jgi:uncharacterized protein
MQKNMKTYIHRIAEATLHKYLKAFPAVGITGPRQSGKSTLLIQSLPDYTYVTFDDPSHIEAFTLDPKGFIQQFGDYVIFDEVQHVPEIFNYLKMCIDQDRGHYGRFVLSGSNQFAAIKHISESLAGRIGLFSLLPLQFSELPNDTKEAAIYKGSYPELVNRSFEHSDLWYGAYIDTYLNKDVRTLTNIGDIRDFQRFVSLLAARVSQIMDMSHYAKDLGVSVPTIKRWLSILEASYVIFLLPAYYENFGKRIIKSPKVYFWDTGLAAYLTGIQTKALYEKGPLSGSLFENYLIADIYKQQLHLQTGHALFYLRTQAKLEVDLIIDAKQSKTYIEIKKSASFSARMLTPIKQFITDADTGYLLYQGESRALTQNIQLKHYTEYLA